MNKNTLIATILIIVLGFAAYASSLNGEFVWDDANLIKENVYIKNWSNIPQIFTKDIGAGALERYPFYRPLQMVTNMIDYSFWKLDVKGYHFTNILLHILAALCIYWLLNILFADKFISFFASSLFVVHPIHTEAVAYISGRADPLCAIFMLLCFIFYIKYLDLNNVTFYILMISSYILALLSRENSLILPILFLLYHYTFKKRIKTKAFLPLLTVTCIYILLRFTTLRHLLPHVVSTTTLWQRIPAIFVAITSYLRLLILPFNLHMDYGSKLFQLIHPKAIIGILILSSLLLYTFKKAKANRLIFFSVLWFWISFLPVANIYPLSAYMAEHWLYLPSIGFFLIVAQGLNFLYKNKQFKTLAILFTISLLSYYSYLTIKQNNYWREPIAFYQRTLQYNQESTKAHNNLANLYSIIGKQEDAITHYKKTIVLDPDYPMAYNNLGVAYYLNGNVEEAITAYKKAIALKSDYAKAYHNLSVAYYDKKQYRLAIECLDRARDFGLVDTAFSRTLKPYRK